MAGWTACRRTLAPASAKADAAAATTATRFSGAFHGKNTRGTHRCRGGEKAEGRDGAPACEPVRSWRWCYYFPISNARGRMMCRRGRGQP